MVTGAISTTVVTLSRNIEVKVVTAPNMTSKRTGFTTRQLSHEYGRYSKKRVVLAKLPGSSYPTTIQGY
jgi:hypothetical protein